MNDIPYSPNESLEESCYEEVRHCSMLILIIRDRLGSLSRKQPTDSCPYFSITRNEYLTARNFGIPIFVFIHSNTFIEYQSYKQQKDKSSFVFKYMENEGLAKFIDEIYEEGAFQFIHRFETTKEITLTLRKQWAGLFNKYLKGAIAYASRSKTKIPVNSFKLFFYRRSLGISQATLAKRANLEERRIQEIEDVGIKKRHVDIEDFSAVTYEEAQRLANGLCCTVGNIKAGLPDDFLSQYLEFYFNSKNARLRSVKKSGQKFLFATKAILFDFDGTMTTCNDNLTTWERIWLRMGYDIKECRELHGRYSNFEISHKKWCKLTENKFKAKGLKNTDLDMVANDMNLMEGMENVIRSLYKHDIRMYILSGSIRYIIKKVLGDLYNLFEMVKANEITFGGDGKIKSIIGTKFDFEGKATFIKQVIEENGIHPMEVFYVGNSINDEWAHESGAQTLCVNPKMTNPYNSIQWMHCIQNMDDFGEILQYMNLEKK
jgi:HAD superfamily phosphoserine phosphatase-like hydrolase